MKALKTVGLCLLLCVALATPAAADELVINGGFQTGNLSGWTGPTGNTGFSSVVCPTSNCYYSNGAVGSIGTISQSLATVNGGTYTLSFELANDGGSPNQFVVTWGGVTIFSLTDHGAQGFTTYTFAGLTASGPTTLSFGFQQNPAFWQIDNISVSTQQAPVPEPTTLALLGTGLVGAALRRRKLKIA